MSAPPPSYYDRLAVSPDASPSEIKRAFRRQMARYHPDKVQHLGQEFQDLAAVRAAELTEAYRVLMDPPARAAYDETLGRGRGPAPPSPGRASEPEAARPEPTPAPWGRCQGGEVVRRAAVDRLRGAIARVFGTAQPMGISGFDLACAVEARRGLFRKAEPDLCLLARFVSRVDAGAVTETWRLAARVAAEATGSTCVFLFGRDLASPSELAAAIAQHRRHWRARWPLTIVPVGVRDWDALVPKAAPGAVRRVIEHLRQGS